MPTSIIIIMSSYPLHVLHTAWSVIFASRLTFYPIHVLHSASSVMRLHDNLKAWSHIVTELNYPVLRP